ncbi:MAG: zf-HC2 domain-containing protein [Lysinibacillus sp.]
MKDCHLVEDLWPLYEENLVQPETKKWMEQHIQQCEHCQQLHDGLVEKIAIPDNTLTADKTIARTTLKLHIYQLLFVVLSFVFAINTSIFVNQGFQFILSYFVLGVVLHYFYKNWILTVLIAFVPTFIWSFYDAVMSYGSLANWWQQVEEQEYSIWRAIYDYITMGIFAGGIHTLFSLLGIWFVVLIGKAFEKEEKV